MSESAPTPGGQKPAPTLLDLYRASQKPSDSLFNRFLARPLATLLLPTLLRSPLTPNQLTFIGLALMVAATASLAFASGSVGLWVGVALLELSYVIDCCDGQLARLKEMSSPVGGALDFMIDELKAYLLIGAIGARWFLETSEVEALWVALLSLIVFASAISLTKFTRSEVYCAAIGRSPVADGSAAGERRGRWWPIRALLRLITQYPASFPIFAFFGLDGLQAFLYSYGALHLLYAGQRFLEILLQLARPPRSSG